jgi:molybdate/tungstate transport system substrate-binding protein
MLTPKTAPFSSGTRRLPIIPIGFVVLCLLSSSCARPQGSGEKREETKDLVVFNAGSLTAPFAELLSEFARQHPGTRPQQESSGSLEAARKLTDLGKQCDVLALADYDVIPSLLIPEHADWYAVFARNQMVLAYAPRSKFSNEINDRNWFEILLRPGVQYGHSNPDLDPAGYRTLLHWQLAETYYGKPGLYQKLVAGMPAKNIRPKSVELIALLQSGELDYVYEYRSVAEQNKLQFVTFPAEIDLSDAKQAAFYANASVEVAGNKPGDKLKIKGLPILFGLTIPKSAPNRVTAEEFVAFLLAPEGQAIMQKNNLITISPPLASEVNKLPRLLKDKVVVWSGPDAVETSEKK